MIAAWWRLLPRMAVRWFAQRQRALLYLGKRDRIPANRSSATAKNNPRLFARFVHKATQRCSESPCVHSRDLCRDSATRIGFTITYKTAGTAKVRGSRTKHRILWVELRVGILLPTSRRAGAYPRAGTTRCCSGASAIKVAPITMSTATPTNSSRETMFRSV